MVERENEKLGWVNGNGSHEMIRIQAGEVLSCVVEKTLPTQMNIAFLGQSLAPGAT